MIPFVQPDPFPDFKADDRLAQLSDIERLKALAKRQGAQAAEVELAQLRKLTITDATSVKSKRLHWLWEDHIPIGEITLIAGRGGVGKSTMLSRIAADITTGNLQGEFRGTPRHVLYVVNEDSLNYTVKPRMVAAGATIEMIHFVGIEDGSVQLPRDMERIAVAAHQYNAACVMLDPLSANLELAKGGDQGPKLRKDMQYMRALCEQAQIAAIGLAHTRKAMTNNLMDAILGSTELGNVCRSAMGVIANPDEEGTYILSQEKANLGRLDVESYTYRIEPFSFLEDGEYIKTSRIEITGTTSIKVSDVLADSSLMDGGQMAEAKKFLKEYLEIHGAVNAKDIKKVAQSEGISISSLQRARKSLDVVVQRTGFGKDLVSVWSLPVAKTT